MVEELTHTIDTMQAIMDNLNADIVKTTNKAAARRARKATLELAKLGKEYRRLSVK